MSKDPAQSDRIELYDGSFGDDSRSIYGGYFDHGDRQRRLLVDDRHLFLVCPYFASFIHADHTGAVVRELEDLKAIFAGIHYLASQHDGIRCDLF